MTTTPARTLRVRSPEELLGAVPHLLGFHPEESLVAVVLRGSTVVLTARADLGPDLPEKARALQHAALANGGEAVVLVGYSHDVAATRRLVMRAIDHFDELHLPEALVADGHRWWSVLCPDQECCPQQGQPYSLLGRRYAQLGRTGAEPPLASRRDLAELVAGPDAAELPGVRRCLEEGLLRVAEQSLATRRREVVALVQRFHPEVGLTEGEYAALAALVHDPVVRDEVIDLCDTRDAPRQARLWTQVVRRSPHPFELAPLCLLGLTAWLSGNGALQVVCLERAEKINPDFSMVRMLHQINRAALPPSAWQEG